MQLQELTNNAAEFARLWIGRGKRAASRGIMVESCDGRLIVTRVKPSCFLISFLVLSTLLLENLGRTCATYLM